MRLQLHVPATFFVWDRAPGTHYLAGTWSPELVWRLEIRQSSCNISQTFSLVIAPTVPLQYLHQCYSISYIVYSIRMRTVQSIVCRDTAVTARGLHTEVDHLNVTPCLLYSAQRFEEPSCLHLQGKILV